MHFRLQQCEGHRTIKNNHYLCCHFAQIRSALSMQCSIATPSEPSESISGVCHHRCVSRSAAAQRSIQIYVGSPIEKKSRSQGSGVESATTVATAADIDTDSRVLYYCKRESVTESAAATNVALHVSSPHEQLLSPIRRRRSRRRRADEEDWRPPCLRVHPYPRQTTEPWSRGGIIESSSSCVAIGLLLAPTVPRIGVLSWMARRARWLKTDVGPT